MVVDGDEEIEHMQCKRISYFLEGSEVGHTTTACSADGIMYERGYMNILTPRFNFNVVPGDIININDPASEVIGVDYVEVLNNHYKRIIFKGESSDSEWKYWVEGIGGNGTNDGLPYEEMENLSDIYIPGTFVKCIENGEVIFEQNDFCMGRSSIDSLPADYESNFEERIKIYTLEGVQTKNLAAGQNHSSTRQQVSFEINNYLFLNGSQSDDKIGLAAPFYLLKIRIGFIRRACIARPRRGAWCRRSRLLLSSPELHWHVWDRPIFSLCLLLDGHLSCKVPSLRWHVRTML